jgi:Fis family transcriptional regulator
MNAQTLERTFGEASTATTAEQTVHPVMNPENIITAEINTTSKPLKDCVFSAMKNYYTNVVGSEPSEVYDMLLSQIEPPLLETTMEFTRGNQSKAAILLGLSRGTLRKKLKRYGLD